MKNWVLTKKGKRKKGSIALTAVLVISAILLIGGTIVVLTTVDLAFSTKHFGGGTIVQTQTRTCFEESMARLVENQSFTGDVSYLNGEFSCTATVIDAPEAPGVKNISVSSSYYSYSYNREYNVDVSQEPFQVLD